MKTELTHHVYTGDGVVDRLRHVETCTCGLASAAWADLPLMRGPIDALQAGEPTPAEGGYCASAYDAARIALANRSPCGGGERT